FVGLVHRDGFVLVTMNDEQGTADFSCRLGNINLFQVIEKGYVEPLPMIGDMSCFAPLCHFLGAQESLREPLRMERGGDSHQAGQVFLLRCKEETNCSSHTGTQDGDPLDLISEDEFKCGLQVSDLTAISDILELAT